MSGAFAEPPAPPRSGADASSRAAGSTGASSASAPSRRVLRALLVAPAGVVGFFSGYIGCALFRLPAPLYDCRARAWLVARRAVGPQIYWYGQLAWGMLAGAVALAAAEAWLRVRPAPPSRRACLRWCGFVLCALLLDAAYCFCLVWSLR